MGEELTLCFCEQTQQRGEFESIEDQNSEFSQFTLPES
jgi:hypothetical protein